MANEKTLTPTEIIELQIKTLGQTYEATSLKNEFDYKTLILKSQLETTTKKLESNTNELEYYKNRLEALENLVKNYIN